MKKLKLLCLGLMVAIVAPSVVQGDVIVSKDVRSAATWDNAFTVTTFGFADETNQINVGLTDTTGLGQSFTATETGNIDKISFGVLRMYGGLQGVVNVYEMFDGDGTTPGANPTRFRNGNPDWMSDSLGTLNFDTNTVNISNSSDGNTMFTLTLTGDDQIAVNAGSTYMVQLAGVGSNAGQPNLALWHRNDSNPYADGIYGIPNGGSTASGRDVALAINIVTAVPEPSTLTGLGLGLVGMLVRRRRNA